MPDERDSTSHGFETHGAAPPNLASQAATRADIYQADTANVAPEADNIPPVTKGNRHLVLGEEKAKTIAQAKEAEAETEPLKFTAQMMRYVNRVMPGTFTAAEIAKAQAEEDERGSALPRPPVGGPPVGVVSQSEAEQSASRPTEPATSLPLPSSSSPDARPNTRFGVAERRIVEAPINIPDRRSGVADRRKPVDRSAAVQ